MHIKRLIIKGFKSYLSLVDVEEFHSGYNVIVGRNGSARAAFCASRLCCALTLRPSGSGKSNLFAGNGFFLKCGRETCRARRATRQHASCTPAQCMVWRVVADRAAHGGGRTCVTRTWSTCFGCVP